MSKIIIKKYPFTVHSVNYFPHEISKVFTVAIIQQWIIFNFKRQPETVDLLTLIALVIVLPPEKNSFELCCSEQSIDTRDLMAT